MLKLKRTACLRRLREGAAYFSAYADLMDRVPPAAEQLRRGRAAALLRLWRKGAHAHTVLLRVDHVLMMTDYRMAVALWVSTLDAPHDPSNPPHP